MFLKFLICRPFICKIHSLNSKLVYFMQVTECISQAMKSLVNLGLLTGHFRELSTLPINNNTTARQLAKLDKSEMAVSVGDIEEPECEGLTTGKKSVYPTELGEG